MPKAGDINPRSQQVMGDTGRPSTTHYNQRIWEMKCLLCAAEYSANGCDCHIRKCPVCQRGRTSEPLV